MSAINNKLQGYYKPEMYTTSKIIIVDVLGNQVDTKQFEKQLWSNKKKSAIEEGKALWYGNTTGWKKVPMAEYEKARKEASVPETAPEVPAEHAELMHMIHTSYDLKPKGLKMNELKWKYLMRSGMRGKNIMMTGQAGCGKTLAAKSLINALDRPEFYFNPVSYTHLTLPTKRIV